MKHTSRSKTHSKRRQSRSSGIAPFIVIALFMVLAMRAMSYGQGYTQQDITQLADIMDSDTAPQGKAEQLLWLFDGK